MIRGTTPTHIFKLPFATSIISKLRVTYAQDGEIILEKTESDCTLDGDNISLKLTQEESFKFKARVNVEIQLKVKAADGEITATTVKTIPVERALSEEVL